MGVYFRIYGYWSFKWSSHWWAHIGSSTNWSWGTASRDYWCACSSSSLPAFDVKSISWCWNYRCWYCSNLGDCWNTDWYYHDWGNPDNSQTFTIFTSVLHIASHEKDPNSDPDSILVHPQDTEASRVARILETGEIWAINAADEASSPESDQISPVGSKLEDLVALGRFLELLVKNNQYTISSNQASMDSFKTRILSDVVLE